MIRFSSELQTKSYDETIDIDDIFTFIQTDISKSMSFGEDKSCSYREASKELIDTLNSTITNGIKSGYQKFDKFSGGYQKSDLVIIAGETSQGKTSLAVTSIRHCATNQIPCAVFSLEMTQRQLVARMTAQETGISSKRIMYNDLSNDEKKTVLTMLEYRKNLPIYFDESSVNDIDKICTSIRKLKIKFNIEIALVDYIQDIKGADTEAGVAEIGRKLKNVAKELDITVIAISQLSRDKANPEPTISRLRGSGQLEEKADVVMMIYRPEYYNRNYSEPHETVTTEATGQVKIVKGRNIGLGSFILNFNKETTNFYDYIDSSKQEPEPEPEPMTKNTGKIPPQNWTEPEDRHIPF
jgi:replicative DNA helicase